MQHAAKPARDSERPSALEECGVGTTVLPTALTLSWRDRLGAAGHADARAPPWTGRTSPREGRGVQTPPDKADTDPRLRTTVLGTLETTAVRNGTFCSGRPRHVERVHTAPRQRKVHPAAVMEPPPVYPSSLSQEEAAEPGCVLRTQHPSLQVGSPANRQSRGRAWKARDPGPAFEDHEKGPTAPPKHQRDAQRRFVGAGSCQGRHSREAERAGTGGQAAGRGHRETSMPHTRHGGPLELQGCSGRNRTGKVSALGGEGHENMFSSGLRCSQKLCARKP